MEQYLTSTDHIIRGRGNYNSKDGRLQLFEQYFLLMEKWKFVTAIKSTFYWTLKIYAVGPQMKSWFVECELCFIVYCMLNCTCEYVYNDTKPKKQIHANLLMFTCFFWDWSFAVCFEFVPSSSLDHFIGLQGRGR